MPDRHWTTQPEAEVLVQGHLQEMMSRSPDGAAFRDRLQNDLGVRLRDLLDYIALPGHGEREALEAAGWTSDPEQAGVWRNPHGMFPAFLLGAPEYGLGFRVEYVHEFLSAQQLEVAVEGKMHSPFRRARVFEGDGVGVFAIERRGSQAFHSGGESETQLRQARLHLQSFRTRRREFTDKGEGFDYTDRLVEAAVRDLGKNWACWLWLRAEREYWERRCRAGRVQKARQDAHGIGWANQDHHTYDSTREWFHRSVKVLETLGFECRELFYAGHQAGWGSQILEQPALGSVIFADIDLAPEELGIDFAHLQLASLPHLRRAGLWCALHGESIFEAGINHLECMYDHTRCNEALAEVGVHFMAPFSSFPHLWQELSEGEWWPVDPQRVDALEAAGLITAEQAEDFRLNGAIGSHLENLERNEGFKGFNQPGIDGVLRIIDPRKNLVGTA